jgi:hypothetical protein
MEVSFLFIPEYMYDYIRFMVYYEVRARTLNNPHPLLKKANIDYNRRDDYLSIEESWDQIESSSYMHIRIIK